MYTNVNVNIPESQHSRKRRYHIWKLLKRSQKSHYLLFFPNVAPGYKIIETPANLVYLPTTLDAIYSMEITLTDQNGPQLNLRGENISIRFHVREI